MTRFVVDASVVVGWLIPHASNARAAELLEAEHGMLAPELIYAEVCNVIWKYRRAGQLTNDECDELTRVLQAADLEVHPPVNWRRRPFN